MLCNENIKGEDLDQENIFWFWNIAILHTVLAEDEFSWHPLNLTNYSAPTPPSRGSRQLSINQKLRAHQEA